MMLGGGLQLPPSDRRLPAFGAFRAGSANNDWPIVLSIAISWSLHAFLVQPEGFKESTRTLCFLFILEDISHLDLFVLKTNRWLTLKLGARDHFVA